MSIRVDGLARSLISVLAIAGFAKAQTPQTISSPARLYLEQVLDLMQKNSLNRASIDWTRVRRETFTQAKDAKTTSDTYPAIAYALAQLKEHHSFLQLPDSLPYAQRQSITAEMARISGSGTQESNRLSPFSPSKELRGHIDHRDGKLFAHIVVPTCIPQFTEWAKNGPYFQQFAEQIRDTVVKLQAENPIAWIIDLRGNGGGNMWPMLAGIGPVIGEGDLGAFESPSGDRSTWFYKDGKVGTHEPHGQDSISAFLTEPPFVFPNVPWVAVLIDRGTGSSGEAVAISFAGRPHERSFGEHTAGFSTSNNMHPLPDGASLFLCEGVEADRTKKRYPDGIEPDIKLPAPDARPSEETDLVLQAAETWLSGQTGASSVSPSVDAVRQ